MLIDGKKTDDGYTVKIDNNIDIGIAPVTVTSDDATALAEFKIVPRRLNADNDFRVNALAYLDFERPVCYNYSVQLVL